MFTLAQATATALHQMPSIHDFSTWDSTTWGFVIMGSLVAILILTWGGVRFWLVVTRPPQIKDVHTPTLDHMNQQALAHMGADGDGDQIEDDNPPADLLSAVPDDENNKKDEPQ